MAEPEKPIAKAPVVEETTPATAPLKKVPPKKAAPKSEGIGAGFIVLGVLSVVLLVFAAGVIMARRGKRRRMASTPRAAEPHYAEAEDEGRPEPAMPIGVDSFGSNGPLSVGT